MIGQHQCIRQLDGQLQKVKTKMPSVTFKCFAIAGFTIEVDHQATLKICLS